MQADADLTEHPKHELVCERHACRPARDEGAPPGPGAPAGGAPLEASGADPEGTARAGGFAGVPAGFPQTRQLDVYGRDNRHDIYELKRPRLKRESMSVAAFVTPESLHLRGETVELETVPFSREYAICPCERFYSQPSIAWGTGFLVGPDLLATAGHLAVRVEKTPPAFVFGFEMLTQSRARTRVPRSSVYHPKQIVHASLGASDFGLIRLDRPVVGRPVARIRRSGKVPDGARLYMFGYPCGLPQKYADHARVHENCHASYFKANLDAYSNDSGSPVYSDHDGVVEGITVSGMPEGDFRYTSGHCMVSRRYPNRAANEVCTRITELLRYL